MKKVYLTIILAHIIGVYAQCPSGSLVFTNQSQINNFIVQYPDCTEINGDVSIGGNISNLNGLASIISKEFNGKDFAFYPNPVMDVAYLLPDNRVIESVTILDINGRIIKKWIGFDGDEKNI